MEKSINLNAMGVMEMNAAEMRQTEGGIPWGAIVWFLAGIFVTQDSDSAREAWNDGRDAAPKVAW
ncbi:MAG: hypothetical protein LBS01_08285 [Prevotellaceae bacterium]|jgi:hypothetical protein|nr:hypothetical protein [Prevotellaceae bacterium]